MGNTTKRDIHMFNFVLGTSMLMLVSLLAPAIVVYNKELKSFYYEQKDKWFGVSTPFVPTYDDVLAEVRKTSASSDVVDNSPTYDEVLAAYKKVRATASKPAQVLTAEKLVKAARHAAQFPAGYFHADCDFPQVDTPGKYTESQQPLANFARVLKLSRDEQVKVINDQNWQAALYDCFSLATTEELLSVYNRYKHVTEKSPLYGYMFVINFVLILRNESIR